MSLTTYFKGKQFEIFNSEKEQFPIDGKENEFVIGNIVKIKEYNNLNGNFIEKHILFTDELDVGEYFNDTYSTVYVRPANELPIETKFNSTFDPDTLYDKPLIGLGATAAAGALSYSSYLTGSISGALLGGLGFLMAPFALAYALPVLSKITGFASKIWSSYKNKTPYVTDKQMKLQTNADSYINILESYNNTTS